MGGQQRCREWRAKVRCARYGAGRPAVPPVLQQEGRPRMLVLTRRAKEKSIFPGINTSVQVVAVKAGAVRLGIEAPPDVAVLREEFLARGGSPAPVPAPPPGRAARSASKPLTPESRSSG